MTITPEDRARLRDLAHRMLETPVRGAASTALAEGVTALLDALDEAERAEAEVERLHSWAGLMELLDENWPESIFPTLPDSTERDAGPRIVSLIRRVDAAEAAVQRVREMHVPQPHGPGQCDPDGCPDLCQECGERMPCTTRRIICERTTLGAGDWEADPAQVARYYSDKRSQRAIRTLDGDA